MTDAERIGVAEAVHRLKSIVEMLAPDVDAQRVAWISFAASFFRSCAPIAKENKGTEYALALDLVAEMGKDLIRGFCPEEASDGPS